MAGVLHLAIVPMFFTLDAHERYNILSSRWCKSTVLGDTCPQEMEQFVVLRWYRWYNYLIVLVCIAVPLKDDR